MAAGVTPFTEGAQFYLPPIRTAIPARYNPRHKRLEESSSRWARSALGLDDAQWHALDAWQYIQWLCMIIPDAVEGPDYDACRLALGFIVVDDDIDNVDDTDVALKRAHGFHRLLDVIAAAAERAPGAENANPFAAAAGGAKAFIGVCVDIAHAMPVAQGRRFTAALRYFADCTLEALESQVQSQELTFDDVMRLRRGDVATNVFFVLAEFCRRTDISDALVRHPELSRIHDVASEYIILSNDLCSFPKEHATDDPVNAVLALVLTHRLSIQDAVSQVCRTIEQREHLFLALRDDFLGKHPDAPAEVVAHLTDVASFMSGNRQWSLSCPRYHGRGFCHNNPLSGIVTLRGDGVHIAAC